jgi:hypothetical protein
MSAINNKEEYNQNIQNSLQVTENLGLEPNNNIEDIRDFLKNETQEIRTVLIAENYKPMLDKNTMFTEMALQEMEENYFIVSAPSEEEAYDVLGRGKTPDVNINLLLTDNKMESNRGGLELSEYAYPMTDMVALHTTRRTLDTSRGAKKINEELPYIDQEYFKTGKEQDLVVTQDYKDMLKNII